MQVKVVKEFLEIPVDSIGIVTNQQGVEIVDIPSSELIPGGRTIKQQINRAMWVKFNCKDLPVGICEPFEMHVKEL